MEALLSCALGMLGRLIPALPTGLALISPSHHGLGMVMSMSQQQAWLDIALSLQLPTALLYASPALPPLLPDSHLSAAPAGVSFACSIGHPSG